MAQEKIGEPSARQVSEVSYEGVLYETVSHEYFQRWTLRRFAGVGSLWALGMGAVISGGFSGWNPDLTPGGFGGILIAVILTGPVSRQISNENPLLDAQSAKEESVHHG